MRRLLLYPNVCFRPKAAISRASVSDPLQKRARLIVSNDRGTGTEDYFGGAWDFAPLRRMNIRRSRGFILGCRKSFDRKTLITQLGLDFIVGTFPTRYASKAIYA
jgi:hypothetical protein